MNPFFRLNTSVLRRREPVPAPRVPVYDYPLPQFAEAALAGLAASPKRIPPKFFYDERGSRLFDAICELPEYYPTRTEMAILETCADDVSHYVGADSMLIEIGSGASKKIRLLLETLRPRRYVGVDISRDFLLESAGRLADDYPDLDVQAVCADFTSEWKLPREAPGYAPPGRKVVFFPGSTIGNLEPAEVLAFLVRLRMLLRAGGVLLIGVDLRKDLPILDAAYNDRAGVTAAFNLNLLDRLRNELGAEFDHRGFTHSAYFNPAASRIEMHLVSRRAQEMFVCGKRFRFAAGETIHTENSYKYSLEQFRGIACGCGFQPVQVWTDEAALFSVHLLRVAC